MWASGDAVRTADEWQMLITYEDLLKLNKSDIIEAGYTTEYGNEDCIFAVCATPLLNYTRKFYISLESGLVVGAEELDESGKLIYNMTVGECIIGEVEQAAFMLPDGTDLSVGR